MEGGEERWKEEEKGRMQWEGYRKKRKSEREKPINTKYYQPPFSSSYKDAVVQVSVRERHNGELGA